MKRLCIVAMLACLCLSGAAQAEETSSPLPDFPFGVSSQGFQAYMQETFGVDTIGNASEQWTSEPIVTAYAAVSVTAGFESGRLSTVTIDMYPNPEEGTQGAISLFAEVMGALTDTHGQLSLGAFYIKDGETLQDVPLAEGQSLDEQMIQLSQEHDGVFVKMEVERAEASLSLQRRSTGEMADVSVKLWQ